MIGRTLHQQSAFGQDAFPRRTAIRNMVRRGVPERVAMRLTGHKTASVFQRYNIVSDGDLRTAAQQLSGLTGTEKGQSTRSRLTAGGETR